jgi:manganese/zinc/iron transport system permease protein
MLIAAVVMGLLTAFLTQFLTRVLRLQEDASTGLVFTALFALGIIFVTLFTRSAHIGVEIVMGNVDSLHVDDLTLATAIFLVNFFLYFLFRKEYLITTFDPILASSLGFSVLFFDYLLMTQTSITSVGAFRAVGVLMVLAFITGPPLTARLLTHTLSTLIALAMAIGALSSLLGVATSRHLLAVYDLPVSTGGIVVLWIVFFFVLAAIFNQAIRSFRKESVLF